MIEQFERLLNEDPRNAIEKLLVPKTEHNRNLQETYTVRVNESKLDKKLRSLSFLEHENFIYTLTVDGVNITEVGSPTLEPLSTDELSYINESVHILFMSLITKFYKGSSKLTQAAVFRSFGEEYFIVSKVVLGETDRY